MALINSENNATFEGKEPSIHSGDLAPVFLNTSLNDYEVVGDEDVNGHAFIENQEQADYPIAGDLQYPINTLDNSADQITHQVEPQ